MDVAHVYRSPYLFYSMFFFSWRLSWKTRYQVQTWSMSVSFVSTRHFPAKLRFYFGDKWARCFNCCRVCVKECHTRAVWTCIRTCLSRMRYMNKYVCMMTTIGFNCLVKKSYFKRLWLSSWEGQKSRIQQKLCSWGTMSMRMWVVECKLRQRVAFWLITTSSI